MELRAFLNSDEGRALSDETLGGLSPAQKARIIYRSRNTTLADKHHAMQEIIETLPDETVQCTDFETKIPFEQSLHQLLREFMAEQKRLQEAFFASEPEVVYLVDMNQPDTGEYWENGEPSLSWEACARKVSDYLEWYEQTGPWHANVTKYYPKIYLNGFMRELTAEFNEFGELLNITSRMQIPLPKFRDLSWHLEMLPIAEGLYAPAPIHKGDILMVTPGAQKKYPKLPEGPMLLLKEPNPENETVRVFCFGLYKQHPELRNLNPKLLCQYGGDKQSTAYLLLKEIASAIKKGELLQDFNQRLGSSLTYPVMSFFPKG